MFTVSQNYAKRIKILQRLTTRVSTGLLFIQLKYLDFHDKPDVAWIRNIYILLSFYTELLLKAVYVQVGEYKDKEDLDSKLQKQGHDLVKIADQIGRQELLNYGISHVKKTDSHEYQIKTRIHEFFVKDFIDIRYDFLDDRVRVLKGDEHEMFKEQIVAMTGINELLKASAWFKTKGV